MKSAERTSQSEIKYSGCQFAQWFST